MKQEDICQITDAQVGSIISVDGILLSVGGKFGERYHTGGKQNDYHTFALDGKRELGISTEGPGSDIWAARYFGTFPMSSYQRFEDKIRKTTPDHSLEEGTLERTYSAGTVPWKYSDYVLGKKMGKGVFLAPNDDGKTFDVWVNGEPQEVKIESFEKRPYGWRKVIDDSTTLVVIESGKNTALNVPSLNEQGLRGHPDEAWERIMHLGYLNGRQNYAPSLSYRFLDSDGTVRVKNFRRGQAFYSVGRSESNKENPGYWHVNENTSDRPIKLLVRVGK